MMMTDIKAINRETFKTRVTTILNEMHRTKSWLADSLGISRQALNYLLSHTNGEKYTSKIAEILNINPDWLSTGDGEITIDTNSPTIPLLKLNNVIHWIKGDLDELFETIPAECHETKDTYAIILDNSSMEEEFAKNSILIFRAYQQPSNGDFVLAKLANKISSFVFRKYVEDGSGTYLKAIDSTFRTITEKDEFKIIGVLIEQRRRFHD